MNLNEEFQQAVAAHRQGDLSLACSIYNRIAQQDPSHADALHMLGDFLNGVTLIQKAISLNSQNSDYFSNLSVAFIGLKNFAQALECCEMALSLNPSNFGALNNKGLAFRGLMRLDDAATSFSKAVSLTPGFANALANLGHVCADRNQLQEAIAWYKKALTIQSKHPESSLGMAFAILRSGELRQGFEWYECRWSDPIAASNRPRYAQPLWLGDIELLGKTILLYGEQGIGDTVQFIRYVPIIASMGARVLLIVHPSLWRLFRCLEGVDLFVGQKSELPAFDFHCPLASLPLALKTDLTTLPIASTYLSASKEIVFKWGALLGRKAKLRVGICWSGNTSHGNNHNRSIDLQMLLQFLPQGLDYICLQKDICASDKVLLAQGRPLRIPTEVVTDFADTAAICELCDLIISVDTSVAHLSAAMGKPTWVLLPFSPDWRWLLDRDDSPWYPSIRLFRQARLCSWADPLSLVQSKLIEFQNETAPF